MANNNINILLRDVNVILKNEMRFYFFLETRNGSFVIFLKYKIMKVRPRQS